MIKKIFKNKLQRLIQKQQNAFSVFTTTLENLKRTNAELEDVIHQLDAEEMRVLKDKETALGMMKENRTVMNNIEQILGVVNHES